MVGDAALLERAVTNLLDNAARWSPPGGARCTVELTAGVLHVADEGPGIADERPARTSSSASTARTTRAPRPARGSAWRSSGRRPSGTAAWSPPESRPPAAHC